MKKIVLFESKTECCGCCACFNICPVSAIEIAEDKWGFIYPHIDYEKCIGCSMCKKVCAYKKNELDNPCIHRDAWVAVSMNKILLKRSASGGAFAVLAKAVIQEDGAVYGCAFNNTDGKLEPRHIRINDSVDLCKIQGSKYVQSLVLNTFKEAKQDLEAGKRVLFSGTPCQIDGLKRYLGEKKYDKLVTVDIVCHGVPNEQIFQTYIEVLERKLKGEIIDFSFRDKDNGWGLNIKVTYMKRGQVCTKLIQSDMSSYYRMFLESKIYRENCYFCPYASANRPADITLGDYWGIEKEHPEYLAERGGNIKTREGVSCLIVNTENGKTTIDKFGHDLLLKESTFEKVQNGNAQLKYPSERSKDREKLLNAFEKGGYLALERMYRRTLGKKYYARIVWGIVPLKLKRIINKLR